MFKRTGLLSKISFYVKNTFNHSNVQTLQGKAFLIRGATYQHRHHKISQLIQSQLQYNVQWNPNHTEVVVYFPAENEPNPHHLDFEDIKKLVGEHLLDENFMISHSVNTGIIDLDPVLEKETVIRMKWEENERTAPHYVKMVNELLPQIFENDVSLFSLNHCTHYFIVPHNISCRELNDYLNILNDFGIKIELTDKSKMSLWTHCSFAFIIREPIKDFYDKISEFHKTPQHKP